MHRFALAAPALLLAACSGGGGGASSPTPSPSSTASAIATGATPTESPSASATPAPTPTAPPPGVAGHLPQGFSPTSVTFVSTSTGFVLGSYPCGSAHCLALGRTADGGHTWTAMPRAPMAPAQGDGSGGVRSLRFADANDGWAFGPELWSTHDGGATWRRQTLPGDAAGGQVQSLEAAAGFAHAAVAGSGAVHLATTPSSRDAWTVSSTSMTIGAGPVPQARVTLDGGAGWAIMVNRTVIGGARLSGGQWASWQPPCGSAGGSAAVAASTTTRLYAVCVEGTWTGPSVSVHLYTSSDAGSTFQRNATAMPTSDAGAIAAASGVVAVGTGSAIEASFNGGASWATVYSGSAVLAGELGFTTSTQGVAVVGQGTSTQLLMTYDGGHHWSAASFA